MHEEYLDSTHSFKASTLCVEGCFVGSFMVCEVRPRGADSSRNAARMCNARSLTLCAKAPTVGTGQ